MSNEAEKSGNVIENEENAAVADNTTGENMQNGDPAVNAGDQENVSADDEEQFFWCGKCGAKLQADTKFCPECGAKTDENGAEQVDLSQITVVPVQNNNIPLKRKNKLPKAVLIAVGAVVVAAVAVAAFLILRGTPVEKIKLAEPVVTVEEGDTYQIEYEIVPDEATDKTIIWSSSDEDVVTVDDSGLITAVSQGDAEVTATAKSGVKAVSVVTVEEPGPDLNAVYNALGSAYYCSITDDYSSLTIDTNPLNIDDYSGTRGLSFITQANELLSLPDSVYTKMLQTRALDGRQTETYGKLTVSWTYHPDQGLEVMYEVTSSADK